jgi:hypothetical protein
MTANPFCLPASSVDMVGDAVDVAGVNVAKVVVGKEPRENSGKREMEIDRSLAATNLTEVLSEQRNIDHSPFVAADVDDALVGMEILEIRSLRLPSHRTT